MIRVPTHSEYEAFDGAHCRNLYRQVGPEWRCPACRRSRFQCMRWTTLFRNKPHLRHQGWAVGIHKHHDHGTPARFPVTPICEQCNAADGFAKRQLRLPIDWSFSPDEIGRFVIAIPHGWHVVVLNTAQRVFDEYQG